ncbi:hypothetical protein [Novipirellula sp.]|uniref:GAP1-N2 domain-containing protein n=1 Tax=Novipirellula sp. TaxID=2795430 RepID=UPI003564F92C
MSLELLYTSAPSGLRQGSRGFCTVLSTAGMPVNVATRLETLSGYRHVFSPSDSRTHENPICYSHLRVKVAGKSSSVLSRIAAYGVDYSGRTNKLAHHVVVEPHEQSPAGPAWVLTQRMMMREQWDGKNQTPPAGPTIPLQNQAASICSGWARITGDAGWGGVVAEAFQVPASRPHWIVFDVTQNAALLDLLNESIALLPQHERWAATFSTYYTNLPPEIDCRVRCVLAGTEEAKLASARGRVIDLTSCKPLATETPLVRLARTGASATGFSTVEPLPARPIAAPAISIPLSPPPTSQSLPPQIEEETYDLVPSANRPPVPPPKHSSLTGPPTLPPTTKKENRTSYALFVVAATLLFTMIGGGIYYAIPIFATAKSDASGNSSGSESFGSKRKKEAKDASVLSLIEANNSAAMPENKTAEAKLDGVMTSLLGIEQNVSGLNRELSSFNDPQKPRNLDSIPNVEMPEKTLEKIEGANKWLVETKDFEHLDLTTLIEKQRTGPKIVEFINATLALLGKESDDSQTLNSRLAMISKLDQETQKYNADIKLLSMKLKGFASDLEAIITDELSAIDASSLTNNEQIELLSCLKGQVSQQIEDIQSRLDKLKPLDMTLITASAAETKNLIEQIKTSLPKSVDVQKRIEGIAAKLKEKESRLAEANAFKVRVVFDAKDKEPKVRGEHTLTIGHFKDASDYTWSFEPNPKASTPDTEATQPKIEQLPGSSKKDFNFHPIRSPLPSGLTVEIRLHDEGKSGELKLLYHVDEKRRTLESRIADENGRFKQFDETCLKLTKALGGVIVNCNRIREWKIVANSEYDPKMTKDEANKIDKKNARVTRCNALMAESQSFVQRDFTDWQVFASENERKEIEKKSEAFLKLEDGEGGTIPQARSYSQDLNVLRDSLSKVDQIASALAQPVQIPSCKLILKKKENAFNISEVDTLTIDAKIRLVTEPESK